jgi:hypothetical protein
MDRLHRYAEQLAKDRGWTSCSLQKAVLHLIDSVPLAKPAERVRAGRRDKSQVG